MSDKIYIGQKAASFETANKLQPITRVTIWYDDENYYTAGDDTGRTLEIDCPWATQAMADGLLASVGGYQYQPFSAGDALMDLAAELGDGVTVNGTYSVLSSVGIDCGPLSAADISAPGEEEVDHEYPYLSPQERALQRKVTLGKFYYGASITRQNGLVIEKTDGDQTTAKVVLNADELSFYDENNQKVLFFDPATGTYKFTGELNVADNFIVDADGNVTLNGSLTLNGSSNWLQARYSIDREASIPSGWAETWNDEWDNTETQVWVIYSYNGGADWTQPMLAQGKDGDRGPQGPSGSDANVPAWVQAYTSSAQYDTLVTNEWVVSMNLYASKIYGANYYSEDAQTSFDLLDGGSVGAGIGGGFVLTDAQAQLLQIRRSGSLTVYWESMNNQFLATSTTNVMPLGTWDFIGCTVKNLSAAAVFG